MAVDRLRKKVGKGRHLSSIKRDRQNEKHRARNRNALSKMRTAVKKVRTERSAEALKEAIPTIARTARKGMIHRKKAARLISRLTRSVQAS